VASVIISLLLFDDYFTTGNWRFLVVCVPMSFVYTGIFWWSLRVFYTKLRFHYPSFDQWAVRLAWLLPFFVIQFVVINFVLDEFFIWLLPAHHTWPSRIIEFVGSFLLSGFVLMLYEVMSFKVLLQKAGVEKAELERKHVASQLEGLRNQVNPHFLFNSLNTLTYLIPETPDKAVRFVQQMSKVYRYVLESRENKVIPLETELTFLQSYIFLLHERFGDNLHISIAVSTPARSEAIAPLVLQMLVENAIKHNIISTEKPLRIEIFDAAHRLVVRNNLQRKNQVTDSTGVGLANIEARYHILTDRSVEVTESPTHFTVSIPLIV
jgi:two-component system, LytTR family, sensor kinase